MVFHLLSKSRALTPELPDRWEKPMNFGQTADRVLQVSDGQLTVQRSPFLNAFSLTA